jgi:hypothetical protein
MTSQVCKEAAQQIAHNLRFTGKYMQLNKPVPYGDYAWTENGQKILQPVLDLYFPGMFAVSAHCESHTPSSPSLAIARIK